MSEKTALIAQQNDQFRRSLGTGPIPGTVVATAGIAALPEVQRTAIAQAVVVFDDFTEDNDPHGEHDFGVIRLPGTESVYWKIDLHEERPVKMFDDGTYAEPV